MLHINLRVNKTVMCLFTLVQLVLIPLYMLSDPDVSIQISFDSFHNLPQQQQSIHGSAASERHLHSQSLQQAEPHLHAYSAEQLAQFFACRGYTQLQILSKRTLYMSPAFVALVRQYEGYEEAVTSLHNELQQTSGFYKWLGRLNGYHKKGLTKQIATLYRQLEQDKQVRASTNEANDWHELCNIYQEYGCGESAHLHRRCDAHDDMQARGAISSNQAYPLPQNVIQTLHSHGHDPAVYARAHGNQFQQVLHQECIELLTRTVDLPVGSVAYNHQEALIDCIDAAREYNQAGMTHKASSIADFCWALLDYSSAVAEGMACGLIGAVRDMVEHPIQTAACVIAGEYVLAYQLCKVVCNVADIGVTALANPSRAKKKWSDYVEPINNIISAIKNKEMTCRDAIKTGAGLAVGLVAQHKLLGGLNKFYRGIRVKAIEFIQNNPSLTPQQYMQTAEGVFMKTSDGLREIGGTAVEVIKDTRVALEIMHTQYMAALKAELETLHLAFDNKIKGFAQLTNKYTKLDYEHIFGMKFIFKRDCLSKVSGFHHDCMHVIEKSGVIEFTNKVMNKDGFYTTDLIHQGTVVKPQATFFPAEWSREKVVSKIYEAYNNAVENSLVPEFRNDGKCFIQGLTNEGIEIEMYMTSKGKIVTAYPKP
jgi:hypothetical protein